MSGTVVHRSVSLLRQTCLCHYQRNIQRAGTVPQSPAVPFLYSQASTASTSHCLRVQQVLAGVSSQDDDDWHSGRYQQHCRVPRTVSASVLVMHLFIRESTVSDCFQNSNHYMYLTSCLFSYMSCLWFALFPSSVKRDAVIRSLWMLTTLCPKTPYFYF